MKHETPRGVKVIKVIQVLALRGEGTEEDPVREVQQYYHMKGYLLAEHDKMKPDTVSISFSGMLGPLTKKEETL